MDNVVDLKAFKESKDLLDVEFHEGMEWAHDCLESVIEDSNFDTTRLYFMWRCMTDMLLVAEWSPDMLSDNLDWDIRFYLDSLEDEE
jgi:hypothetical protein